MVTHLSLSLSLSASFSLTLLLIGIFVGMNRQKITGARWKCDNIRHGYDGRLLYRKHICVSVFVVWCCISEGKNRIGFAFEGTIRRTLWAKKSSM